MPAGSPTQVSQMFTLSISGKEPLSLRSGEIVTAEVLHAGQDNTAMIRLKNSVLDVRTDVPLYRGGTLTLRIERRENAVYLKLAGIPAQHMDTARSSVLSAVSEFGELEAAASALTRLIDLLKRMPSHIQENLPEIDIVNRFLLRIDQLSGKALQDSVMNGGVLFESKLRILALGMEADGASAEIEAGRIIAGDLKASLLRLKDTFLSPVVMQCLKDTIPPVDLIHALNAVLQNIEFYQIKSKLTDSLWYFLPLVCKGLRDGEVLLWEIDQGKPGGRAHSCTINLDIEAGGKMKVDMLFHAGYVHVSCAAENENLSRALQEGADLLDQRFRGAGLRLGNFSVRHQTAISFAGDHLADLYIHA